MRKVTDERSAKLLEETAQELQKKPALEKEVARLRQDLEMTRYALGNIFKVLQDFPLIKSQLDQLDYRTLGTIGALEKKFPSFSDEVTEHAKKSREDAFWTLSDEDDKKRNLVVSQDPVGEDDVVIITTDCEEVPEQGLFRSKMDVGGAEFKEYKDFFVGKLINDQVNIKLMGRDHIATILGVRKKSNASE